VIGRAVLVTKPVAETFPVADPGGDGEGLEMTVSDRGTSGNPRRRGSDDTLVVLDHVDKISPVGRGNLNLACLPSHAKFRKSTPSGA
jgi:hypothetical protein